MKTRYLSRGQSVQSLSGTRHSCVPLPRARREPSSPFGSRLLQGRGGESRRAWRFSPLRPPSERESGGRGTEVERRKESGGGRWGWNRGTGHRGCDERAGLAGAPKGRACVMPRPQNEERPQSLLRSRQSSPQRGGRGGGGWGG